MNADILRNLLKEMSNSNIVVVKQFYSLSFEKIVFGPPWASYTYCIYLSTINASLVRGSRKPHNGANVNDLGTFI